MISAFPRIPCFPNTFLVFFDFLLDRQSRPGTAQTDASGNIVQSGLDFEDMPTFIWNGRNYVTKVATDIDFLDGVPTLQRALGFRLTRNPFVLPGGLDQMPMAAPEIPVVVPTLSSLPAHKHACFKWFKH